ncbi:AAA family ATPase [Alicyclobacillus macrosporangiidus]|uniref:ATPase family associated with various cellular activities (AAA) n=1 Tax=Alicyclobacillus macrosporangiidus TaxID=392015 RepID=A0A1I7KDX0_9BACL|nr:AAA family ATPase [Alicyclobacillus macrosporangiidus]SFU95604.1 ATPase family associated with various cellular activities (AAA) [Alicyclobacillus macrosporangiidus]
MNVTLLKMQVEVSLGILFLLSIFPSAIYSLGFWYFDFGRYLQFWWRFVCPIWLAFLIFYNIFFAVFTGWHPLHLPPSLGIGGTLEAYGLAFLVWGVLNYLSIGPTQLFALITKFEMYTLLSWRADRDPDLGAWIDKEFSRARRRRALLARALHLPAARASTKGRLGSGHDRSGMTRQFQESMRWREQYRPDPTSSQMEQPENETANGRVRWREKGKQYQANPDALRKIIGMQDVVQEIRESILLPLKSRELMEQYDVPVRAGILLYGPPGNGKTALARAVAESLGLYFIYARGSDLQGTLVGATEQNITSLFEEAKRHAPAIIFIDEIDAIGGKRGGMNPYHDSQLNQLLAELDGFEQRDQVFVIAATNRIEALDEALVRPGRLGTKIYVPNPSDVDIRVMWWRWTKPVKFSAEFGDDYLVHIPVLFQGASGAEVNQVAENLRRRAVLARQSGQEFVATLQDVVHEVEKVRGRPVPQEVIDLFRKSS